MSADDVNLPLAGVRVLVVEDDRDSRELMKVVLGSNGAVVTTAQSADEGLAIVRTLRPDVLISDIGLPSKGGHELLRAVRALPAVDGGSTPAIALSGFATPADRARSMSVGFAAHLTKPFDLEELLLAVTRLAGR